ncbi:hypothetical protein Desor_3671 [Desulfosporosinus orientis DSM 765]|uniref:Uncharacterized protein n=1 Tax=Desulfosporosinus orientis (strain ATCC 19365 / DSM 765 / NCIMB 8382 / VKM B-1628 / Singapore I) TaxID=768706 RepID=G7WIS4_DESOD|nr:hypothetical protein [Desulfosporosinus orientis]AET69148.1 hypothetical protein Desor_3671 [Desulfosporosinus orientis DSM 765]
MLAEFKFINDPLRPSISTNLCSMCYRNTTDIKLGCCSYEPEFCLFDLVFLYLNYPQIYIEIFNRGQIIRSFNGIMVEMKMGLSQCPFATDIGCVLPKDAIPPLCRLFICREAAMFGPAMIEEKFEAYFSSKEYDFNNYLNGKLVFEGGLTIVKLHQFIQEVSPGVKAMIQEINRTDPPVDTFQREISPEEFGILP